MKRYICILPLALAIFPAKLSAQGDAQRPEISPLLKTAWGQQAPFYYRTPEINGEHAKTGCVATAMSQLIYFHQYPVQGKQGVFNFDNFSFDFANTNFNYSAMKEKYDKNDSPSDLSVTEVANLMYACGVTVNMDYGVESSSGNFSLIPGALNEWFLYPKEGMGMLVKDYFTTSEWEDVIYEELAAGRPVLYMGGNGASSHVFVCDGYRDGKYHMNLGWYGEKNDYLPLSNLQTERVGKDGLWSMNASQKIIRGIHLEKDEAPGPLATATSFTYDTSTGLFTLTGISCFVDNTPVVPGIRLVNTANSNETVLWADKEAVINRSSSTFSYSVTLSGLEDGEYTIRPAYKLASQNEAHPVYCNILNTRYYTADISSNSINNPKAGSDIEVNVSISEYTPASTFIKGENYGYGFTVMAENTGNTTITKFGIRFCKPGTDEEVISSSYYDTLAPGDSRTVSLGIPYTAAPGEYDMVVYDAGSMTVLSEPIRVIYHDSREITTIEGSPYRYMPLSADSDEAMILLSKTSAANIMYSEGEVEIESTAVINGKEYRIAEIGPRLLYGRDDITSLTIPSTVRKIDAGAFANCSNIAKITVEAPTPPSLHSSAFSAQVVSSAKLSVPAESVSLYREAPVWENFTYDDASEVPTSMTLDSFTMASGSTASSSLVLKTTQEFTGCQFKMTMPAGLELTSDGIFVNEILKGRNFTVSCSDLNDDNSYTVLMYSSDNTPYPAGENPILDFSFISDPDFKGGLITLSDIVLSKEDGDVYNDVGIDSSTCLVSTDISTSAAGIKDLSKEFVDIYSVSGIVIAGNVLFNEIKASLAPGLYILRSGTHSQKVMIHE